ncbi:hypothetical protein ACFL54_04560 [Planctomycetota bacterium]
MVSSKRLALLIIMLTILSLSWSVFAQADKVRLDFKVANERQLSVAKENFSIVIAGDQGKFPDNTQLRYKIARVYPVIYALDREFKEKELDILDFNAPNIRFEKTIKIRKFAKMAPAPGYYRVTLTVSNRQRPKVRPLLGDAVGKASTNKLIWIGPKTATLIQMKDEIATAREMNSTLEAMSRKFSNFYAEFKDDYKVEEEKKDDKEDDKEGKRPPGGMGVRPDNKHQQSFQGGTGDIIKKATELRNNAFRVFDNGVMTEEFHLLFLTFNRFLNLVDTAADQVRHNKELSQTQALDFTLRMNKSHIDLSKSIILNINYFLNDAFSSFEERYTAFIANANSTQRMQFEDDWREMFKLGREVWADFQKNYDKQFVQRLTSLTQNAPAIGEDGPQLQSDILVYLRKLRNTEGIVETVENLLAEMEAVQKLWSQYADTPSQASLKTAIQSKSDTVRQLQRDVSRFLKLKGDVPKKN